jgi:hypothetical protein
MAAAHAREDRPLLQEHWGVDGIEVMKERTSNLSEILKRTTLDVARGPNPLETTGCAMCVRYFDGGRSPHSISLPLFLAVFAVT